MSCLGVHFALSEQQVATLRAFPDDRKRLDHVHEIEEELLSGDKRYAAETDKSWDALHRLLADGLLTWSGGTYPLNHVVLAGELLYSGDDYIMSLKTPQIVADIAEALGNLTSAEFRSRYFEIDADDYDVDLSEDDLEYTMSWFEGVRDLYSRAASEGRYVLFTADQ